MYRNGLNKTIRLISKFMTPHPGKQLQYTVLNISKSKDNHAMKFGQLIQYKMKDIFLEKSYTKCGGETSQTLL